MHRHVSGGLRLTALDSTLSYTGGWCKSAVHFWEVPILGCSGDLGTTSNPAFHPGYASFISPIKEPPSILGCSVDLVSARSIPIQTLYQAP